MLTVRWTRALFGGEPLLGPVGIRAEQPRAVVRAEQRPGHHCDAVRR